MNRNLFAMISLVDLSFVEFYTLKSTKKTESTNMPVIGCKDTFKKWRHLWANLVFEYLYFNKDKRIISESLSRFQTWPLHSHNPPISFLSCSVYHCTLYSYTHLVQLNQYIVINSHIHYFPHSCHSQHLYLFLKFLQQNKIPILSYPKSP